MVLSSLKKRSYLEIRLLLWGGIDSNAFGKVAIDLFPIPYSTIYRPEHEAPHA